VAPLQLSPEEFRKLAALAMPERLEELALADSLSVDVHKWLYQPLDCSALLYRDAEIARESLPTPASTQGP
jgi:glutamate/tyrosine decarboxylase-like PLP-dependent enzyme